MSTFNLFTVLFHPTLGNSPLSIPLNGILKPIFSNCHPSDHPVPQTHLWTIALYKYCIVIIIMWLWRKICCCSWKSRRHLDCRTTQKTSGKSQRVLCGCCVRSVMDSLVKCMKDCGITRPRLPWRRWNLVITIHDWLTSAVTSQYCTRRVCLFVCLLLLLLLGDLSKVAVKTLKPGNYNTWLTFIDHDTTPQVEAGSVVVSKLASINM